MRKQLQQGNGTALLGTAGIGRGGYWKAETGRYEGAGGREISVVTAEPSGCGVAGAESQSPSVSALLPTYLGPQL